MQPFTSTEPDAPQPPTAKITPLRLPCETRVLGGRYRVRRMLGRGRVADVYLGDDLVLERAVAIKILHEDVAMDSARLEQFRRDAVTLACVRSPHIVGVYDIGLVNEGVYLVMQHIEGQTVAQEIARTGPMPRARAEVVLTQLLSGLAAMHGHGLVHQDLRPANVLLDRNDEVVLLDLGLVHSPRPSTPPTVIGKVANEATVPTSLPEPGEYASDVYQVGLLMVFLLTGVDLSRRSHRAGFEDLLQQLPGALASVARRALDTDVSVRYASAAIMKEALETAIQASSCEPERPRYARSEQPPLDRPVRETRATTTMSAAHLLALLTDDVPRPSPQARDLKTVELEATQIVSARLIESAHEPTREPGRDASEYMRTPLIVARERRNVLIVDEDKSFDNALYRMLTPTYRPFIANDAAHVFAQLEAGAKFDVLICGLIDPVELHTRLATVAPELAAATLFLTSSAYGAPAQAFVEGLSNRRLAKPVEATALRKLIAEQIASSRRAATAK